MDENNRILIIDDDPGVRESYREILSPPKDESILEMGALLFGGPAEETVQKEELRFEITVVERGAHGVAEVERSLERDEPYAAAFVDMRMPGMDGAEATRRIWSIDPRIKIVIVTAYSEHSPEDIIRRIGREDIFYLRKPSNSDEIRQFARTLTHLWRLEQEHAAMSLALKEANSVLTEMNRSLEQKVAEQTAMLIQSEKMATVGILAAGVAHEINNPIAFINGNLIALGKYGRKIVRLLEEYRRLEDAILLEIPMEDVRAITQEIGKLKEQQKMGFILADLKDLIDDSLGGASRIRNIVDDLRTFSRLDVAERRLVDVHEALDATLNIIWSEIKHNIDLVKSYGRLPKILCASQRLSQVLMNLLINAAHSIEGSGRIRIETECADVGSDRMAVIRIADTGCGIAPDILPKIFDPFFTTKPVGKGTGLGLSISYDIIKSHGGDIHVESQVGKGSVFTVTLPITRSDADGACG